MSMTPREIVQERRAQVAEPLRSEITPKNILMIGPTGVGKTEIARRLAKLAKAPFVKVEATKFTEVGYVGREVDSIIRDLVDVAIKQTREMAIKKLRPRAEDAAEDRVLDALLPPSRYADEDVSEKETDTRQKFRKMLREGKLDDKEIEIDTKAASVGVEIMAPPGMEEMTGQLQSLFQNMGGEKKKRRRLKVKDALKMLIDEEAAKLIDEDELKQEALDAVENHGIVFVDEFDKIAKRSSGSNADVSREGVQRDLLPLVEGSTVNTKYGMIKTDHILFIASGAFSYSKPSDLIPELQGRFPIRVELNALNVEDFVKILTETNASLTTQYQALLKTEDLQVNFTPEGIQRIAEVAFKANENMENIGARRLHTVMERLLEKLSYDASDSSAQSIDINADYVDKQLEALVEDEDLSRYIL